jgi:hypothetical protein
MVEVMGIAVRGYATMLKISDFMSMIESMSSFSAIWMLTRRVATATFSFRDVNRVRMNPDQERIDHQRHRACRSSILFRNNS